MNALTTDHTLQHSIITLIENNPKLAPSTKKQYTKAISQYLDAGYSLTDAEALARYAQRLSKSSRAFLKAAVRLWGDDVALKAKGQASPENIAAVQATVYRIEALNEAIKVEVPKEQKAHTWLTQSEVKNLLDSCNTRTIQGKRDKIVLGLLVGAGLRREELVHLTFAQILVQPIANRIRTVLNVEGKGAKDRVVPINDRLAAALEEWQAMVGGGYIARAISKGGAVGESLSAIGVFQIVRGAGEEIGKPELAPHDFRRTYAQLGYEAGVAITQISKLLGHANVATTQRYLNLDLDLKITVSDFIPF
ncbi:MAG: site-specific integrase [Anaerolineae bacterium]|nr:site-specific integrase [Anaerolineae bacterium]